MDTYLKVMVTIITVCVVIVTLIIVAEMLSSLGHHEEYDDCLLYTSPSPRDG